MTHDFAKKPKAGGKQRKKTQKTNIPGWVWLFTGIVTGVFISFLGFLADIKPDQASPATPVAGQAEATPANIKPDSKTSTTRFDFYTLLPEREMIVPTQREDATAIKEQSMSYILQAGSFKSDKDADRLRARLLLMGLDARVEQVTVKNGGLWHRVQVGPFDSRSQLSKARSTLINEGIDTLLLKRKAKNQVAGG